MCWDNYFLVITTPPDIGLFRWYPLPPNISPLLFVPHWPVFAIVRKLHSTTLCFAYVFPDQLSLKSWNIFLHYLLLVSSRYCHSFLKIYPAYKPFGFKPPSQARTNPLRSCPSPGNVTVDFYGYAVVGFSLWSLWMKLLSTDYCPTGNEPFVRSSQPASQEVRQTWLHLTDSFCCVDLCRNIPRFSYSTKKVIGGKENVMARWVYE